MRLLTVIVLLLVAVPAGAATPIRLFEDDRLLVQSGAAREPVLDGLKAWGVGAVRVQVWWHRFDNEEALVQLDGLVASAQARGIRVMLTPSGVGKDHTERPDPLAFGEYVRRLGARYPGVHMWSLWNEPNHPFYLRPQRVGGRLESAAIYRELYRAGRAALEATGHGRDTILIGESLPVGTDGPNALNPQRPLTFARELFCLAGTGRAHPGCSGRVEPLDASGWSIHDYYPNTGPFSAPLTPLDIAPTALGRLQEVLDLAARRGRLKRRVGLWDTEDGVQTTPPDRHRVSLASQARFINEAEYIAWADPRIRSFSQYALKDDRPLAGFQSGLRFRDGRAKPALAAYRLPIHVRRARRGALVWGRIPPPGGTAAIEVDGKRAARVGASGYFTKRVRRGHRYRIRYGSWSSRTASP